MAAINQRTLQRVGLSRKTGHNSLTICTIIINLGRWPLPVFGNRPNEAFWAQPIEGATNAKSKKLNLLEIWYTCTIQSYELHTAIINELKDCSKTMATINQKTSLRAGLSRKLASTQAVPQQSWLTSVEASGTDSWTYTSFVHHLSTILSDVRINHCKWNILGPVWQNN